MIPKLLLLFALLTVSGLLSQTIPQTDNICFFQDAKTGKPITIVNDSLVYKGELKNPSILKHTDYPGNIKDYTYHFNIKKHNYLVHVGGGSVLEYRNDSIVRIDNSFLHKNQYDASPFIYKEQICLFGGYGMFTDKNIITRFDFAPKEWLLLHSKGEEMPSDRREGLHYFDKDGFYLFGGWNTKTTATFEKDRSIWYFNFATLKWICLGNYNEKLVKIISKSPDNYNVFQTNTKLYLYNIDVIIEIDFKNNKMCYFENKNFVCDIKPCFDDKSNSVVFLQTLAGTGKLTLRTISLSDLLKKSIKSEKLYYSPWQEYFLFSVCILLILVLVYLIYRWIISEKGKHFVYYKSTNKLYYKSKIISSLDPLEEKVMLHLIQNNKSFIQLNQLNFIFEKESQENFTNVIKKRDLVFSSLLVKLNAFLIRGEEPLFIIQKNEDDKRIKEIKLNPLYFSLK